MSPKLRIKKGDTVIVTAGRDKGKKGEVIGVFREEQRALVKGVNMVSRHEKPSKAGGGGIVKREARIHISNLAVEDPKTGKPARIGYTALKDGRKVRIARPSGEVIDV